MNKISEKFKSVRVKLFFTLSIIVILIIALLIIMNSIVLETFYTVSKISAVKKEYNIINDLYNTGDPSVLNQIKRDALANNFDILVEDENYMFIFSTNENFASMINQNSNITNRFRVIEKNRQRILYSEENMVIKKMVALDCICTLIDWKFIIQ